MVISVRGPTDIAYALGMKIVSNSRRYHEGYEWLELDELCKVADIISVHVPLNNKGMIDEKRFFNERQCYIY